MSKKQELIQYVEYSLFGGKTCLSLHNTTPANEKEVILVAGEKDIRAKLNYIYVTYNDDLVHNYNPQVKILEYRTHDHNFGLF